MPVSQKNLRKPRVLLAPLDWGLGHATRCVPIVRELLSQGCEVYLAGEGAQESLLREEFPYVPFLQLKGYRARYAGSALGLLRQMIVQSPKFLMTIRYENNWLKRMVHELELDAVISDNRYGLSHPDIPCIFITHQLYIQSPLGNWGADLLRRTNYHYINRFSECWVPDLAGHHNLAAVLAHPKQMPRVRVNYIGPLSRFNKQESPTKKGSLLFLLSGPEPQRTILENKIVEQVAHYEADAVIVRGLPNGKGLIPSTNMIRFYNHLPTAQLEKEILQSDLVISRSGYSTVMDLAILQKKAVFIPTPGQTEQEYLAKHLSGSHFAPWIQQDRFTIHAAIKLSNQFEYRNTFATNTRLEVTIRSFVQSLG